MRTLLLVAAIGLSGCAGASKPDVVGEEYERLGDAGYIYTARHRGHTYTGAVVYGGGVSMIHSPECECHRQAEAQEASQ